jgi:class 3 adenylate cyclase/pimeloyl-ACP methyl ester carboxylesterase
MNATPDTRYARTGGVHIAYQLFGDGPVNAIFVPWWWNNVEAAWEEPGVAQFYDRLGSFCRVLVFDQRGTGLSDPVALNALPTLEEWMDDLRAVLDAAQWPDAAVIGHGDGGLVSLLFAASYPERTRALVLVDAYARLRQSDDQPWAVPPETIDSFLDWLEKGWGTGDFTRLVAPSQADNPTFRRRLARAERLSVSPGGAVAIQRLVCDSDLTSVLPTISAPTLVIAHAGNPYILPQQSLFLAEHITNACHVVLPGEDHLYWVGDLDGLADEIETFLTGAAAGSVSDRLLANVLFTDIVGSTDTAAELGDQRWRRLLDRHDEVVRRQVERFRGSVVNTTGDGFVTLFDGPGRAVRCACAIRDAVRPLGIDIRAGIHTGEIEQRGGDVAGIAVNIAARVASRAEPRQVLVSRTVVDLTAGSGIGFVDRGEHDLKGVPQAWRLYAVEG